jgi:hypothetical protein
VTFDIPNLVDAGFPAQTKVWNSDWHMLGNSAGGANGIVGTGCAVTTNGNMTLAVAGGTVKVAGVEAAVTGGNVTITTAHATLDRIDLVVVNGSGTKSVTAGTAASTPVQPALPASSVCLASIYVPAADTVIGSTQIKDRRIVVPAATAVANNAINTVKKIADETVTSSTTFQDDDHLFFTAATNSVYRIEFDLFIGSTSATPQLKVQMTLPASATIAWNQNPQQGTSPQGFQAASIVLLVPNQDAQGRISGWITTAGTGGTCRLQWAQNVSDAASITLKKGTLLRYELAS